MTTDASPARLGIAEPLVPRFAAVGWIGEDGLVAEPARGLLRAARRGPEPEPTLDRIIAILEAAPRLAGEALNDPLVGRALVAIAGSSRALSSSVRANPDWFRPAEVPELDEPVDGDSPAGRLTAVRRFVRRRLLWIAVRDLLGQASMPEVGRDLADTADAAAAAALAAVGEELRRSPTFGDLPAVPFTVIAMGKWGGQELNYSSDIDMLFVYDPPHSVDPDLARQYANKTATEFMAALGKVTPDGAAFRVDADLRPEGKNGPLARSLDSYAGYYERWAQTWEFQSLIKARPAAGDPQLGQRFTQLIAPHVYPETLNPDAIRSIRTMKARIEGRAEESGVSHTEIKRGFGGIRDVEFAVQLLQLVHGRFDEALRSPGTLDVLVTLGEHDYVRDDDAQDLAASYKWLRNLEHRIQLYDLQQTHTLPDGRAARTRLAKSMGFRDDDQRNALDRFEEELVHHRATIRTIHERLFYRPLLEAFAASPAVNLSPEGADRQLAALGFQDADAARRALAELTTGLSRRSRLMQQMLPLMMDWLSEAPHPDLGLEQLRLLVTSIPDNAALIGTLRDAPVAAERLCRLLGTSRLLGQMLDRIPEFLSRLGDDRALAALPAREALIEGAVQYVLLRTSYAEQFRAVRRFVRRRLLWIAVRDLLGQASMPEVGRDLADTADAAAAAALAAVGEELRRSPTFGDLPAVPFTVIAMGKWGGQELNYSSDIDMLFVYDPPHSVDPDLARQYANKTATEFMAALGKVTPDGAAFRVDADLRPEGKNGPLARSLDSYAGYYERWAQTWEFQSLIKARPAAGDPQLGQRFTQLIAPHVYPETLNPDAIRSIRTMKARIERERLGPGEDPEFHLKLGKGGMNDVEFLIQLYQMRFGSHHPAVRTPGTEAALEVLVATGHLSSSAARDLSAAYQFCGMLRNRLFLQYGRPVDSLPTDQDELTRLALSLGRFDAPRSSVREEYRRLTRRARRLVEQSFYRD
jgi:glutamate-ammonia-ligase adenylyltransferase